MPLGIGVSSTLPFIPTDTAPPLAYGPMSLEDTPANEKLYPNVGIPAFPTFRINCFKFSI